LSARKRDRWTSQLLIRTRPDNIGDVQLGSDSSVETADSFFPDNRSKTFQRRGVFDAAGLKTSFHSEVYTERKGIVDWSSEGEEEDNRESTRSAILNKV